MMSDGLSTKQPCCDSNSGYCEEECLTKQAVSGYQTRPKVAITKIEQGVGQAVEKAIELSGGLGLSMGSRVLIKPNLVFPVKGSTGIVTNPEVVEGVIRYLLKLGLPSKDILVGEASIEGIPTERCFAKSGIGEVCASYGVEWRDLFQDSYITLQAKVFGRKFNFKVSRHVVESDLVINVPVVKTHFQVGMSMALKNMKGVINDKTRKSIHKLGLKVELGLDKGIAALNYALPDYFTVADGTIGLHGMGPGTTGIPAYLGLILASRDPVALEATVCEIVGLPLAPHTSLAHEIGVGQATLDKIEIVGQAVQDVKHRFDPPSGKIQIHPDINIIDRKSCTGCMNTMWAAVGKLADMRGHGFTLVIGCEIGEAEPDLQGCCVVLVGDCACSKVKQMKEIVVAQALYGCPPTIEQQRCFYENLLRGAGR